MVFPGYNSCKEDVCSADRGGKNTVPLVVPSSEVCNDLTIYHVGHIVRNCVNITSRSKGNLFSGVCNKLEKDILDKNIGESECYVYVH